MVKKYRKPHQHKKTKPIYRNRFFWLAVIVLLFFAFSFYFLFFSDFFQIKKVSVSGLEQIEKSRLDPLIREGARSTILFFSSENIFLVDLGKMKENVLKNFPRIAGIEIRRAFPDGLNILIMERSELAAFCLFDFKAEQEEDCFTLDKEGVIFETRKEAESIIKIKKEKGAVLPFLGERVVEKEELAWLLEINSELEQNLNIPVQEFIISPDRLTVVSRQRWEIYFSLEKDVKWQLTKLKVLLEERIPEEERAGLEYIELRFGNFANPKYIK